MRSRGRNVIAATSRNQVANALEVTHGAGIGAYVGVPLVPDGAEAIGMLGCISRDRQSALDHHTQFLEMTG